MAVYNGNDIFLSIDGTQIDAYFIKFSFEPSIETEDITHGSGATHMARADKLKDTKASLTIAYDVSAEATILPLVEVGRHTIIYGLRGNSPNMPKHEQDFIIEGVSHETEVSKSLVQLEVSMTAAAAPVTDMHNGGVWS